MPIRRWAQRHRAAPIGCSGDSDGLAGARGGLCASARARATSTVVPVTARWLCERRPAAPAQRVLPCRRTGRLLCVDALPRFLRLLESPCLLQPRGPSPRALPRAARHRPTRASLAAADAAAPPASVGVGSLDLPVPCRSLAVPGTAALRYELRHAGLAVRCPRGAAAKLRWLAGGAVATTGPGAPEGLVAPLQ